ncbi:hypothetical protein F5888DRAFT_1637955 [Russula emetica]|nr:hypothetical protein F5888DRAFT_1637955 [Russula emetica]
MCRYKTIARILLILPIINFAFALPIAVQETRQVISEVVPDVAITMSAKRADEMENQLGMYFERLSGKKESDLAGLKGLLPAPDHGSMDPQIGSSEIQQVSPELSKSPSEASLDHYLASPGSEASLDHYLAPSGSEASVDDHPASPGSEASVDDHPVSTDFELGSSQSAASGSGSGRSMASSPMKEKPGSKSFLSKVVSKLKFWRRISVPGSVRDAVNAAQRELRGLVDTGATMVRDIGKSLSVPATPAGN